MKKLVDISGQLDTVKRIVCMDDEFSSNVSLVKESWTVTSFPDVEKLGRENPADADLPLSTDIAVIMYTSGSTGLPKVSKKLKFGICRFLFFYFLSVVLDLIMVLLLVS